MKKQFSILTCVVFFVVALSLVFVYPKSSSAATFGTYGVDANCGGDYHGYYTGHFNSRFTANSIAGGPYETVNFQTTNTAQKNQNNDTWTVMLFRAYSDGYIVMDDTSQTSNVRTEVNSTYWQTVNKKIWLTKGNNRVDFHIAYALKYPSGQIAKTYYPVRRSVNIN